MSFTYEEALVKIKEFLEKESSDYEVLEHKVVEKEYGWFFPIFNRKNSLFENEMSVVPGGFSGVFLFKEKEIIIPLGSSNSFEGWISNFDKRYKS